MTEQNTSGAPRGSRYRPAAKALHWLIVLLVTVEFAIAILMPEIHRDTPISTLINLHFSFGLLIVAVMAVRLLHRLRHPVPLEAAEAPPLERLAALTVHRLFYLLLLVAPFLGWASASAHGLSVSLFGLIDLPALAAPKARWALQAGDLHMLLMWGLLALVGLHAAAALYHHFIRRDGLLRRMLPAGSN
jgi:cytochrome b561